MHVATAAVRIHLSHPVRRGKRAGRCPLPTFDARNSGKLSPRVSSAVTSSARRISSALVIFGSGRYRKAEASPNASGSDERRDPQRRRSPRHGPACARPRSRGQRVLRQGRVQTCGARQQRDPVWTGTGEKGKKGPSESRTRISPTQRANSTAEPSGRQAPASGDRELFASFQTDGSSRAWPDLTKLIRCPVFPRAISPGRHDRARGLRTATIITVGTYYHARSCPLR